MKRMRPQSNRRIALSFPSGGAVGVAACMAFLRLTRRLDIDYSEFHGTSSGAGFAGAMGLGMGFEEMERLCYEGSRMRHFIDFNVRGIWRKLLRGERFAGLIKGQKFERQLAGIYGGRRFQDCVRDTFIYAEPAAAMDATAFNRRDHPHVFMHQAVRASASIHFWMKPRHINGVAYADGGILECVPLKRILVLHRDRHPKKKLTLIVVSSLPLDDHRLFDRGNLFARLKQSLYDKVVVRTIRAEYAELQRDPGVDVYLFHPPPLAGAGTFSFHHLDAMIDVMQKQFRRQFFAYEMDQRPLWSVRSKLNRILRSLMS